MKRVPWLYSLFIATSLTVTAGCANRPTTQTASVRTLSAPAVSPRGQNITWRTSKEYEDFLMVYIEKDEGKKAAGAEQFLETHKDSDPQALTSAYSIMFLGYANVGNWAKVLEAYDHISVASRLTDDQKSEFRQLAATARQRSGR